MKRILLVVLAAFILLPAVAKNEKTVTFKVPLHCQGCINRIYKTIAYEKGVKDLQCSIENHTVQVTFDSTKTDVPTLLKAFECSHQQATVCPSSATMQGNTK